MTQDLVHAWPVITPARLVSPHHRSVQIVSLEERLATLLASAIQALMTIPQTARSAPLVTQNARSASTLRQIAQAAVALPIASLTNRTGSVLVPLGSLRMAVQFAV